MADPTAAAPDPADRETLNDATAAMQDDVAELLRVLGRSDHARPCSPHDVVQHEILPVLRAITHADQGSWKQLAMQAMRFLTVDEIVAATKAAGLASNTCRR